MAWQRCFQFRLSTILLLTTLSAVCFGWYVDHYSYLRNEIVGEWVYLTPDELIYGYWTRLTINRDGTFTKRQFFNGDRVQPQMRDVTYSGTYTCQKDGQIVFHVKGLDLNSVESPATDKLVDLESNTRSTLFELQMLTVGSTYSFRCAVDKWGYLVMNESSFRSDEGNYGIRWEPYMSAPAV